MECAQPYELKSLDHQKIIAIDIYCGQEGIIWVGTAQQDGLPLNEIKDLIVQKDKIYLANVEIRHSSIVLFAL